MFRIGSLLFGLTLALAGTAASAEPLRVGAAIPPLAYLVHRIAPAAEVALLVPPGGEAHTFDPRPATIAALAGAAVYFSVGLESETAFLERLRGVNPDLRVIRLDAGLADLRMVARGCADGCTHAGDAIDPHVWLAPRNLLAMAGTVAVTLAALDPAGAAEYRSSLAAFSGEIGLLDAELSAELGPALKSRIFFSFHPSWGYFARAYGLTQVAVEAEGKEPGPADLARLVDRAAREGVRALLVQPQFGSRAPQVLADSAKLTPVPADDLAADWAGNLRRVARGLADALK